MANPDPKTSCAGCGCLGLLAVLVVLFTVGFMSDGSDISQVEIRSEIEETKRQIAQIQGADPEPTQDESQRLLDTYTALLQTAGVTIVQQVVVRVNGESKTATLTVGNIWHIKNRQVRLQDAQNLWKAWSMLASPSEPDKARISIRDLNGNEVGGSRVLGGSLIWVQA